MLGAEAKLRQKAGVQNLVLQTACDDTRKTQRLASPLGIDLYNAQMVGHLLQGRVSS
jgi:hypothetical protein